MRLSLPLSTFEFRYTGIEKLGASSYVFTGTDLRITVLDEERITVNYRIKDQPVSGLYAVMEDEVAEVAARELERRAGVLARFTQAGSTFSSSSYGTIRISADGRFAWQGFERLVPAVIGPRAGGGGRIDFPLQLSKPLAAAWDGALTLVFDEDGQEASFLYKAVPGGVRMSSLAGDSVKDLEVVSAGFAPVVIFFSQSAQ
jgi:hypothetical protein